MADIIWNMEDDILSTCELIEALRVMGEAGHKNGLEAIECKALIRVALRARDNARAVHQAWCTAFELTHGSVP